MIKQKHIISKVFFEVNTSDIKTAYYLKDNLDVFLKQSLFPTIQAYFDSLTSVKDQIIRFDKLELSIDSTDAKDQVQLQLDIIKSLQKQLILKKESKAFGEKNPAFLITDKEKSDVDTFLYFLKSGQNPWWVPENNIEDAKFLETIISNKNFNEKLSQCLFNSNVRQRLTYQFTDDVLIKIFNKNKSALQFPKALKRKIIREHYWEILLKYIADRNIKSLQRGLVSIFLEVQKEDKIEKNVNKILLEESTRIVGLQKINELQKINIAQQIFKLKHFIIKSLKEIIFKQLKLTQKTTFSEQVIYSELRKHFDVEILDEVLKISSKRVYQMLKEEFDKFKEQIVSFTSVLISEKLEDFQYDAVKTSDSKINKDSYQNNTELEDTESESFVYIHNAGLLLLHPYIEKLFSTLKLLNQEGKIKPEKVTLAIHLLHFVATKREKQVESNLVFEKFLCGYPIDKPIRKNIRLPQKFKDEAESLLKAVVNNWHTLKNTSGDGLRENFIKREGKLMLDESSKYRIIVARKTQDILLEKLPWNLTIIKFPWVNRLIFVEW
ncbi:contractile injection system tape measure protein [uncultured Aquimarina sp.]|uniref:contractile injection system tape measure protein n=1 Tax=uncultured Aquimarina sp. TaxID=575652 RepID=UPI0026234A08|nr:contractile injection system tape measure protein [uncultured Aquimarina sp.]